MVHNKQGIDMLHGRIWTKVLRFALPVAATGILEQLFNASGIMIVGNFSQSDGTAAVAAVGSNAPVTGLILNLFIGIALGANVVIANAIGRGSREAVRNAVHTSIVTALIGGGGKTTLMYHLARELRERGTVAVTTTTKIWPPTGIAVAQDPDTAREILAREGLVCLGVPSAQGKLVSPGFEGWDALADYTLVEADGSAGKPFKGHEKHEPVLPPRRNTTILVLGADGFGRPISVAAHRPALYARLAGVPENRPVTPAIAARVAAREGFHDQVFVNQVDQEEERPLARQLAERLDCPVAAGSLRSGCWEKIK